MQQLRAWRKQKSISHQMTFGKPDLRSQVKLERLALLCDPLVTMD